MSDLNETANQLRTEDVEVFQKVPLKVESWLGNRGIQVDDNIDPWYAFNSKCAIVNNSHGKWLFIENQEFSEVDVYSMISGCAEIEDEYKSKDFSWSDDNLRDIARNLHYQEPIDKMYIEEDLTWLKK